MARDERRMTFVVVPHGGSGDLSTRSYEISYRSLRMATIGGVVALALIFLMAASWIWVGAQAAQRALPASTGATEPAGAADTPQSWS